MSALPGEEQGGRRLAWIDGPMSGSVLYFEVARYTKDVFNSRLRLDAPLTALEQTQKLVSW